MVKWRVSNVLICAAALLLQVPASAHSEEFSPRAKIIRGIVVVEGATGESAEPALERTSPAVAVVNQYLIQIGFLFRAISVEVRDSLPGRTSTEIITNLQSEFRKRDEKREIVLAVTRGVRNDGYLGLALPNTACQTRNAFASIAYLGASAENAERSGRTLAHELGHFLGAGHDPRSVVEGGLFSLMHPMALALTGGFSGMSRGEIERFTAEGTLSGACFTEQVLLPAQLRIQGPEILKISEGETLNTKFAVEGAADPVRMWVSGLPPSARFDAGTGELTYTPDHTLANGSDFEFSFTITVENFFSRAERTIRVIVHDVLTLAPRGGTVLDVIRGQSFSVVLLVPPDLACRRPPKGVTIAVSDGVLSISGSVKKHTKVSCSYRVGKKKIRTDIKLRATRAEKS